MDRISILLIDDDAFLSRIYSEKLESQGFDVHLAGSGEEGLRLAEREVPACVLLDILLPGADGFEILEKFKDNPAMSQVPVIMVSSLGQREDVEKARSLGAAGYLIKSHILPQDVVNKVKEVLK